MAGTKTLSEIDFSTLKGINAADGTAATDVATKGQVDTAETNAKSRANHTGTQTANTISDFDTQVRTSRLDQMAQPTNPVAFNSQRGTNVGQATADTDIAQWGQVKDLISGQRKTDVRAAPTANVNLAAPGTSFDGVTLAGGDTNKRLLLTQQTAPEENGIYDWTASGSALTRASDADVAGEFATEWLVTVQQGTANGNTLFKHDTPAQGVAVTLGSTALTFSKVGPIASGGSSGYTTTCPAVSAGATWTITHNLNTKRLLAQFFRVASPYDEVRIRFERPTVDTIAALPDVALSSGEYEVMILAIGV